MAFKIVDTSEIINTMLENMGDEEKEVFIQEMVGAYVDEATKALRQSLNWITSKNHVDFIKGLTLFTMTSADILARAFSSASYPNNVVDETIKLYEELIKRKWLERCKIDAEID